jgi:peptidoglycan/xylan/chitin deacetylase (PgdA/CDA1 family)
MATRQPVLTGHKQTGPALAPVGKALSQSFLIRRRLQLYILAACGMPCLIWLFPESSSLAFPVMIVVHAVGVGATFIPNCQLFGPVATHFGTNRNEVWLTIDDGPHPEDTPRILELLRKHNARATFFSIGRRVEAYRDAAGAVIAQGHELANHSYTHPVNWFWGLPPWSVAREIDFGARAIRQIAGPATLRFRSPLGLANLFVHLALKKRGMRPIGWSARGFDAVSRNPDRIVDRIMKDLAPGTIVLLHEGGRDAQGRPVNVLTLERLLVRLGTSGYTCIVPTDDQLR